MMGGVLAMLSASCHATTVEAFERDYEREGRSSYFQMAEADAAHSAPLAAGDFGRLWTMEGRQPPFEEQRVRFADQRDGGVFAVVFRTAHNRDWRTSEQLSEKVVTPVSFNTLWIEGVADSVGKHGFSRVILFGRTRDGSFTDDDLLVSANVRQDFSTAYGAANVLFKIGDFRKDAEALTHFKLVFQVEPIGGTFYGPEIGLIQATKNPVPKLDPTRPDFEANRPVPVRRFPKWTDNYQVKSLVLTRDVPIPYPDTLAQAHARGDSGAVTLDPVKPLTFNALQMTLRDMPGQTSTRVRLYGDENLLADWELEADYRKAYGNNVIHLRAFGLAVKEARRLRLELRSGDSPAPASALTRIAAWQDPRVLAQPQLRALGVGDVKVKGKLEAILDLPYCDGMHMSIFPWKDIEKQRGQFDWSGIDRALKAAHERGKNVSVQIDLNHAAPDWLVGNSDPELLAKGVRFPVYEYEHLNRFIRQKFPVLRSPVPWDPNYLAEVRRFVRAFGARYNGHPDLLFVCACGPSTSSGVESNWVMLRAVNDTGRILNWTYESFERGWKQHIGIWSEAFPTTPLCVGLHSFGVQTTYSNNPENVTVAKRIRDHAVRLEVYERGKPLYLRHCGFHDWRIKFDVRSEWASTDRFVWDFYRILWERLPVAYLSLESTRVWGGHDAPLTAEDFWRLIENGVRIGGADIEIKTPDWMTNQLQPVSPYADLLRTGQRFIHGFGRERQTSR